MAFVWRVRRHPVEVFAVQDSRGLIVIAYPFLLLSPLLAHHSGTENVKVMICLALKGGLVCVEFLCLMSLPSAVLGSGLTGKRGYIQSIIVSSSGGLFLLLLLHNSGVRQRKRTYRQEECLTVRLSNSSAGLFMKCCQNGHL